MFSDFAINWAQAETNKILAIVAPLTKGPCQGITSLINEGASEANKLNDVVPVNLTNEQEKFTLAELMSTRTAEQKAAVVKSTRTMGFY